MSEWAAGQRAVAGGPRSARTLRRVLGLLTAKVAGLSLSTCHLRRGRTA